MQAAGAKGKRFCMPNARIMMHSPAGESAWGCAAFACLSWCLTPAVLAGGAMGSADEVMIQAKELNRTMRVSLPWQL